MTKEILTIEDIEVPAGRFYFKVQREDLPGCIFDNVTLPRSTGAISRMIKKN